MIGSKLNTSKTIFTLSLGSRWRTVSLEHLTATKVQMTSRALVTMIRVDLAKIKTSPPTVKQWDQVIKKAVKMMTTHKTSVKLTLMPVKTFSLVEKQSTVIKDNLSVALEPMVWLQALR